jgi:serine/threonine protein kinase
MTDRLSAEDIFFAALEKAEPAERAAYVDEMCAGNESLRRRVGAMLAAHPQVGQFLERPIVEAEGVAALGAVQDAGADLSFLAPSSEPGSLGRLDHYEVLAVVGKGGMGVVLRVHDTKLLRVIVLKVLAVPLAASGSARQRFAREARAAAAVRDEHVIDIHAVRDDTSVPYLVMEYIGGCNLEVLLRRSGPREVKEILRIGIQIARGLAAAHQQGLIHRDVKPANILLENGVQRVKLTGLDVSYTQVSDLSPLEGMPLDGLCLTDTPVSDLSPLKGMPLTNLNVLAAKVTDLSPLKGMRLKDIHCSFQRERDAALLRSLTTLERINDKPAADFWKEVDGQ